MPRQREVKNYEDEASAKRIISFLATKEGKTLMAQHKVRRSLGPIQRHLNERKDPTIIAIHEKGPTGILKPTGYLRFQANKITALTKGGVSFKKRENLENFNMALAKKFGLQWVGTTLYADGGQYL